MQNFSKSLRQINIPYPWKFLDIHYRYHIRSLIFRAEKVSHFHGIYLAVYRVSVESVRNVLDEKLCSPRMIRDVLFVPCVLERRTDLTRKLWIFLKDQILKDI